MPCAAILCAGPSLVQTWQHALYSRYDVVIAVNRAILHEPSAHWWCAADWDTFAVIVGSPTIGICSIRDAIRVLPTVFPKERWHPEWKLVAFEDLPFWSGKSSLGTIGLALYLKATEIDIYGDDKSGETDCSGIKSGDREPSRWAFEAKAMKDMMDRARDEFGVVCTQIRP
jgi:hypothetical protein